MTNWMGFQPVQSSMIVTVCWSWNIFNKKNLSIKLIKKTISVWEGFDSLKSLKCNPESLSMFFFSFTGTSSNSVPLKNFCALFAA